MEGIPRPGRIGHYVLRDVIGEGAFSLVVRAFDEQSKMLLACKIVPRGRVDSAAGQDQFEAEVRIFRQLSHPCIVALFDVLKDDTNYYLLMEFCTDELLNMIVEHGHLGEERGRDIARDVLAALEYLHGNGIAI